MSIQGGHECQWARSDMQLGPGEKRRSERVSASVLPPPVCINFPRPQNIAAARLNAQHSGAQAAMATRSVCPKPLE